MSKTVKIALELNLENAEQLALYLAIGASLGNGVKVPAEQTKPSKDLVQVVEAKPTIKMSDILGKVTALIMTVEAKDKNEPVIRQWMQDHEYTGKIAAMPEDMWNDFYAFINTL